MGTWIMTADRAGARIFERDGNELILVEQLFHDEGRLRDAELGSDEPGRSYDSARPGRHSLGKEQSPHEHDAADFARNLAHKLRDGRVHNRFTRLVIAAEPHFLGLLRAALDKTTGKLVVRTVPEHLQQLPAAKLVTHVLPLPNELIES